MTPSIAQPVLVYNRISQNRRKTVFLVIVAVLSIVPFVAALSFGASEWLVGQFGRQPAFTREEESSIRDNVDRRRAAVASPEATRALDRELEAETARIRLAHAHDPSLNGAMRWKMMALFA